MVWAIARDEQQRNTKGNGVVIQIMHKKDSGFAGRGNRGRWVRLGAAGEGPAADEGDDDVDAQLFMAEEIVHA